MAKRREFFFGVVSGLVLAAGLLFLMVSLNTWHLGNAFKGVSLIKARALEPLGIRQMVDGALKGIVHELNDPYSVYLEPEEFQSLQTHMKGTYGGLGIYVGVPEETKRLTVMAPIKGTPAAKAGIKSGDEIWEIDGKDAREMDIDTAVSLMKGPAGTKVTLGIRSPNEKQVRQIPLIREIIEIPSVEGKILEQYPDLAYVNISMFNDMTGEELLNTVTELTKKNRCRGLILDLRNNPGGSLKAAMETGGFFVPKGEPVVWLVDKQRTQAFLSAGRSIDLPLVVLINKGSASASEILAGAIKDVQAGTLVGENTFGKGIVQSVFKLGDGAAIKITTAKYL
ncbi:MAG TPA: S41 family peptidase, partial [Clostridia bacterium]|nr:S41 family peptidase [Clostridia bacterium]